MALPIVLFSSSTEHFRPQDFVRSILKAPDLPEPEVVCEHILSYKWHFETKYYDTTIHLCTAENNAIGDEDFAGLIEAFIHFFDPNSLSSFAGLQTWLPSIKQIEPEVQMLVCTSNKNTDVISRQAVQEWCIQHGFELVELLPETDTEEDDFPETTGMARIIQALHAHTWPNVNMKCNQMAQSPYIQQHLFNDLTKKGATIDKHTVCNKECASDQLKSTNSKDQSQEQKLAGSIGINTTQPDLVSDDQKQEEIDWKTLLQPEESSVLDVEEFEQLFTKLKVMKDKADTMSEEEKKKYAEKVAVSFWRAIGGDEDEIEGLDEDSD